MTSSFVVIKELVASLPEVQLWPELAALFDRAGDAPRPDWELPILACEAVSGSQENAYLGAAAVACLQLSIILIDDILDDDLRGAHRQYGVGPAANIAAAYQAAAIRLIQQSSVEERFKSAGQSTLAKAALDTAVGQQLDIKNLSGEDDYWRVIRAKSTPFYGAVLELGAHLGKAEPNIAAQMHQLGVMIGEIIQIEDDLTDALEIPANADWIQGRNNLLILYARTADHKHRDHFFELLKHIEIPGALNEAQQILVSSGAVAYAAYQLIWRYHQSRKLLDSMALLRPEPLVKVLKDYADTLVKLLEINNPGLPADILQFNSFPEK